MTRVLCLSVTATGAAVAERLPYEHRSGGLVKNLRKEWASVDGFIVVGATGLAVRATAPLLGSKLVDPAVVSVDDRGRWVIALAGGHSGGANALAREVAALLGAEAVITSATDAEGLPALDALPGYRTAGDVSGVVRRWLDGEPPLVRVDDALGAWPLPPVLSEIERTERASPAVRTSTAHTTLVTVTDSDRQPEAYEVLLRPASLVAGVGASSGAEPESLQQLLRDALAAAGLHPASIGDIATIDRKASEPAVQDLVTSLGAELHSFEADRLAAAAASAGNLQESQSVREAVGTPSVAEAAALIAAGPGATLVVGKAKSPKRDSTVAIARRARPPGTLSVVGLGPGRPSARTYEACRAVRHAEVVIGYEHYLALAADLIAPSQLVIPYPIGTEAERCREALARAARGQAVALVCSGDPGVYAMASLIHELAPEAGDPPVDVLPGVTAAQSAAALLGSPLGHDHASISLSDLLTPWREIERRLEAAAEADFVVVLYNPRSNRRPDNLPRALSVLAHRRPAQTPAAIVTNAGRPGQEVHRSTLRSLDWQVAGMLSTVIVGSSTTRWISGRMVTPRGYSDLEDWAAGVGTEAAR